MKSIADITKVVQAYAAESDLFITPQGPNDPLMPQPEAMTPKDQKKFFNTLLDALAAADIKAKLPFKALMGCDTWAQVRILIFHWQD